MSLSTNYIQSRWDTQPLGTLCDILDSQRKPITKCDRITGEYPYYGATGVLDFVANYIFSEKLVLIGEDGAKWNSGDSTAFIVSGKFWVNNHAHVVRPHRDKVLDEWIAYYLNIMDLTQFVSGLTVPKLNQGSLKEIPIPLAPIKEQRRIVAILDDAFERIDKAIANTEKNIANTKELFESCLDRYFKQQRNDWKHKTLEEISIDFGRGKSKHRPRNDPSLYHGAYPFVQTGDVRNSNQYIREFLQTYNEKGLAQSKLWPAGTVCITIAANIAEIGILTFDSCFPDSVIGVTVDNKNYSTEYLYYILQFMSSDLKKEGKGSAQENINLGTFEKRTFPFPSFNEQQCIVAALNELYTQIKSAEETYKSKLASLRSLKQSLLAAAFSGELTADFNPDALEL